MVPQRGMVDQPQVSYSVKGSSVSQIIMKREVCLRAVLAGRRLSAMLHLTSLRHVWLVEPSYCFEC